MIIKTTTSLLKNIKNIENFFDENSNVTVLTNKNKIVWALITQELWSYLFKNWIIDEFENNWNKEDSSNDFDFNENILNKEENIIQEKKIIKNKDSHFDPTDPSSIFA